MNLRLAAFAVLLLPCGVVGSLAALLVYAAHTDRGRAMGLAFLLACAALLELPYARKRLHLGAVALTLAASAASFGYATAHAPDGDTRSSLREGSGLQAVWLGSGRFTGFGLANLTPEIDQIALGGELVPFVDAHLDHAEADAFVDAAVAVYDELAADPAYARAGSVQGLAYRDLFTGEADAGHVWVDLAPVDGPQPALVFLHGFGGNLAGYTWVLRDVAHERGYAVVSPSFGAGLWYRAEGVEVVSRTLDWMAGTGRFDMDRVVLVGLSNGGFGVAAAATEMPEAFRGIAWISGVVQPDAMPALAATSPGPVMLLHGGRDDRIPLDYVMTASGALESGGVVPTVHVVEDADHFLMFSHRDDLEVAIGAWLDAVDEGG